MKLNGGTCPSLETIGAFVDDRLKEREREVIAEHVATCETCYFVFTEAARTRVIAEQPRRDDVVDPAPPPVLWWKFAMSGLAAAAVIVLAVNVFGPFGANGDERALAELVAAVGTTRTFEPRLTGGFVYAPVRGLVRGPDDAPNLTPDVRIAIAEIEKQHPANAVAGTAALIGGNPTRAIAILEQLSKANPGDAKLQNDLAAAYLVAANRNDSTDDASRALAAANRALEIDPRMSEALFNRGLAAQAAGLRDEARAAWQAYLKVDDRSGWADEARAHLRILSNQL